MARHRWRQPHTDHRLLLVETPGDGLLAVGAHEADVGVRKGQPVDLTYLEVAAVRVDCQGAVLADIEPFEDGRPVTVGRFLMEAMLSDLFERDRGRYVHAIVARENERSLRLCAGVGLTEQREHTDGRYVQLLGVLPA